MRHTVKSILRATIELLYNLSVVGNNFVMGMNKNSSTQK